MKTIVLSKIGLWLLLIALIACRDKEDIGKYNLPLCDDLAVAEILDNKPAYITKGCVRIDTVATEVFLISSADDLSLLCPSSEIPEKYRVENKQVLISGEISSCYANHCYIDPHERLASIYTCISFTFITSKIKH
ncbi:hypothetical protein FACS1894201_03870 [Bacteroidia bacterium]|nr:hypothetical protein FACS1894201_03870 [Bacteroidia bacterium]